MNPLREQVHAVLMTLHQDTLLLPNAAVVEVMARDSLQPDEVPGPDWLLGHCEWNNRRIPVVRFERLNGVSDGGDPRRERLVVLSSSGRHLSGGQLAIVTQGYPHLVTLNRKAVRGIPLREADRDELVLARVRIANQEALIPDLEEIEAQLARARLGAPS